MSERWDVEDAVRRRFASLAADPSAETAFPVGPASAKALGYPPAIVDALPAEVTEAFAGVGNPLGLSRPAAGETILDLGCGGGFDCILAAREVGPTGRAIGIDFTEAMIDKARRNAALVGARNAEFRLGVAESIPVSSGIVDRVITNGVFNLCFDKAAVAAELRRVLRPGGRLQMADILLEEHVTPDQLARLGEWSA